MTTGFHGIHALVDQFVIGPVGTNHKIKGRVIVGTVFVDVMNYRFWRQRSAKSSLSENCVFLFTDASGHHSLVALIE